MSFMEKIFGAKAPNTDPKLLEQQVRTQATQQQQPGMTNNLNTNPIPQGTQQTAQTSPNGTIPEGGNQPPAPMEQFNKIWETTPADPNKPVQQIPDYLDPAKLAAAASKVDFKSNFALDDLKKVLPSAGDAELAAFQDMLNKAAQSSYVQGTVVATKLADQIANRKATEVGGNLPIVIKSNQFHAALVEKLPVLKNPAVAPLVDDVRKQLVEKFPDATAQDLVEMGTQYFQQMAAAINPNAGSTSAQSTAQKEEDWDKYLSQ